MELKKTVKINIIFGALWLLGILSVCLIYGFDLENSLVPDLMALSLAPFLLYFLALWITNKSWYAVAAFAGILLVLVVFFVYEGYFDGEYFAAVVLFGVIPTVMLLGLKWVRVD